jgi:hypothetical protein
MSDAGQPHGLRRRTLRTRAEGMRIGGTRRLEMAAHLGYADRGIPGVIPPHAALTAEITLLGPGGTR